MKPELEGGSFLSGKKKEVGRKEKYGGFRQLYVRRKRGTRQGSLCCREKKGQNSWQLSSYEKPETTGMAMSLKEGRGKSVNFSKKKKEDYFGEKEPILSSGGGGGGGSCTFTEKTIISFSPLILG